MRTWRARKTDGTPPCPPSANDSPLWQTLVGRLCVHAGLRPNDVALREKKWGIWQETTWSEYLTNVEACARSLRALGVSIGDHVAILSDNRPEWVYADLAVQGLGARSVGIYQTNPAPDVAYILSHSGSKILFCEDQEQVDKAVEIAGETPTVTHIVVFDPRGTTDIPDPRLLSYEDFLLLGAAAPSENTEWFRDEARALDPKAPSMVVYTSGTTGNPKGALLSPANALTIPDCLWSVVGGREDDQLLSYLPLCHVAEKIFSLFLPLTGGSIVHFGEAIETIQEDLREVSPTVFLGVPRIWEKMHASVTLKMNDSSFLKRTLFAFFSKRGQEIAERRHENTATAWDRIVWFLGDLLVFRPLQERLGLRRCSLPVSGAAPISRELLLWFHGIGVPIVEGYGQTECGGVSHIQPPGEGGVGTVGRALPGVEVRLAEDGEILVHGPNVFVGYLHNTEATEAAIGKDGWLHTGDLGAVDDRGFTSIVGRKKEIIITAGGKNLSPEKIENTLKVSPYIKEAIAIGDRRKFVSALIQIDRDSVGDWAQRQGLAYTSYGDLASKPEVRKLVSQELDLANDRLAKVEQIRNFSLLPKELNQDDGELTATQKVRRKAVEAIYEETIEKMYGGKG